MITIRPGKRGHKGHGGGAHPLIHVPVQLRASTNQLKGLYPFIGSGTPMVGVPVGKTIRDHGAVTVCCDPISWFERGNLISNPSMFILGLPGLGKSSLIRRIALGLAGYGALPMVPGDVKAEYVALIRALGGQVVHVGPSRGSVNLMNLASAIDAARRIGGLAGERLLAAAMSRRQTWVEAMITVQRGRRPEELEVTLLALALTQDVTTLTELITAIQQAQPATLLDATHWRGDENRYYAATDPLCTSLDALVNTGLFNKTTTPLRYDVPTVFDLSAIPEGDQKLRTMMLLTTWSATFEQVDISLALSDAGLALKRRYLIVLDELWSVLRAGTGLVDLVDALSRLNRGTVSVDEDGITIGGTAGVGTIQASHTMSDLKALPLEEDRAKAAGLVERAGILVCAGLPRSEVEGLLPVRLSRREQDELVSRSTPPTWDAEGNVVRPGRGKFLAKVGGRPGISFELVLTDEEKALSDTNRRWA